MPITKDGYLLDDTPLPHFKSEEDIKKFVKSEKAIQKKEKEVVKKSGGIAK